MSELTPPGAKTTIDLGNGLSLLVTPTAYTVYDGNGNTTVYNRSQNPNDWLTQDVTTLQICIDSEAGHQARRLALLDYLSLQLGGVVEE